MDLSRTIIPKSDQLNFEDVQSSSITAVIKSVRAGNSEQPVFIDLDGYDGRPYKPSKSMRRVLIGGWGNDGHSWVGKALTLIGDSTVKFGGVAVGGIKVSAMSDINSDFSLMLTTSRGKRSEHRVKKLEVKPVKVEERTPDGLLAEFTKAASSAKTVVELDKIFKYAQYVLAAHQEQLEKATDIYGIRKAEMEEVPM
ncbi:hypothetical protein DVP82_23465 [Yersinia enterocolitica]|uniref:hypothetical protein n=1 Tax=Yersinia intermedia TaxID=631 RepID=UPI00119DF3B7|nr:hypothetical protein [Yersinia intermedia]EKN5943886.1 hypothetical protein [Yersinia enterocolitica]MCB5329322.1 hypothetical protein [Yersinia intermedia]